MKKHTGWSYNPYRPLFFDGGDIYICRVAPTEESILFDWLDTPDSSYRVYYRVRGEGEFVFSGETNKLSYEITGLNKYCDYEFYVCAGDKKSRVRLARCGEHVGSIVNYLHPEDEVYGFSERYLCSPSLLRHPDGYLLASMDVFAPAMPQNLTLIYRSDDSGRTWTYVSEMFPCFWGRMFLYEGDIYMLSCSTEYGDLLIGKSTDGAKTFSEPVVLFRGSNGKGGMDGVHKNPQPVVEYDGRIYNTLEWGSWGMGYHAPMVMSAKIGDDLLDPESWTFSEPVKYNPEWKGVAKGPSTGNIEGCLVKMDGGLYNVMRYDMRKTTPDYGKVISYKVDTKNPEVPLEFSGCIDFPANHAKFEIKYDDKTKKYYSIASRITSSEEAHARNLLSLMVSEDGKEWNVFCDIYDKTDCDRKKIGFQYVDFIIEDGKIIFLCRTAMNNANSYHDSNYITFDCVNTDK